MERLMVCGVEVEIDLQVFLEVLTSDTTTTYVASAMRGARNLPFAFRLERMTRARGGLFAH